MALFELAVRVPTGVGDDDPAWWESILGVAPSIYSDVRTGRSRVSWFIQGRRREVEAKREALKAVLREERAGGGGRERAGHGAGSGARVTLRQVPREDWAESWKRHFRPMEVSPRLLIRPSWSRRRARVGQRVLILDPGLSFGTGQHPTTAFCLEALDGMAVERPGFKVLDVGMGSGILALAAKKLGAAWVEGFDFDPVAVRVARANARRNRIRGGLRLGEGDVTRWPRKGGRYDVVCANLTADLLEAEMGRLAGWVAPDGMLVLAGILKAQFPALRTAAEGAGLRLERSRVGGEWQSGVFRLLAGGFGENAVKGVRRG